MKGDFSRITHNPTKQYTHVNMQQGRVQIDADWNEKQAIDEYHRTTRGSDIIGLHGTPAYSKNGFAIDRQGTQWRITEGHFYVDGILCVNETTRLFEEQPFPYANIPDLSAISIGIVYLDVWRNHISAAQDGGIREKALGGADTATRTQTVWQANVLDLGSLPDSVILLDRLRNQQSLGLPEWDALIAESTGTLNARTNEAAITETPCELPPSAGYVGLENQLYRIEIHQGSDHPKLTFKWSRNNAFFAVVIESMPSNKALVVASTGRDELLSFQRGDWVELIGDPDIYAGSSGQLLQVDIVDIDSRTITLMESVTQINDDDLATGRYLLRRWDQSGDSVTANGVDIINNWVALEKGIQIKFSDGTYRPGDYWLIPARTVTGEIEWPPYSALSDGASPPAGIQHHYCPLALIVNNAVLSDLRLIFPPLNHIKATDVRFDNSNCGPNFADSDTVQEAINVLCHQNGGHCTLHLAPEDDVSAILAMIPDGAHAKICFKVGIYNILKVITLTNKGHLILEGSGEGTSLITQQESVFSFKKCSSVTVSHLSAQSTGSTRAKSLNGALNFEDCGQVTIDKVSLQCKAGFQRLATCLTIRNNEDQIRTNSSLGLVRIRGCQFDVGHLQTGVLLVNINRATIEDNFIKVADRRPPELNFVRATATLRTRKRFRRLLVSNATTSNSISTDNATNVSIRIAGQEIRFLAPPTLINPVIWEEALNNRTHIIAEDPRRTLYALADSILLDTNGVNSTFDRWLKQLESSDKTVTGQGIVIGGRVARDIRILHNTIDCALQGIHVGVSHSDLSRRALDSIETVTICGNTIRICLPSLADRERHGIFVGNASSILIKDNHITLKRFPSTVNLRVEGIRVFGFLGKRMIIEHNHAEETHNFIGIRVTPINNVNAHIHPIWRVSFNVATVKALDKRIIVDPPENRVSS